MKFKWQAHYLYPNDLRHAHHNGYSILWAQTQQGRFMIGEAQYEVSPKGDGIARFYNRKEMEEAVK